DVGRDVPFVPGEPAPGAAETRHDLIEDEQDTVSVAYLADRAQVAIGRRDDAVCAGDRLEDDRGHCVRPLILKYLFEVRPTRADRAGGHVVGDGLAPWSGRTAAGVGSEHAHDAGKAWF